VLRTLTLGLRAAHPQAVAFLIGSRRSGLFDEEWWQQKARQTADAEALVARLLGCVGEREAASGVGVPLVVVVDDADPYADGRIALSLEGLVARAGDAETVLLVAMSTFRAARSFTPWVQALRHQRSGMILQPEADTDGDVFHLVLPRRSGLATPPGRGYLVQGKTISLIQVAS
jgi:hypothetical protein